MNKNKRKKPREMVDLDSCELFAQTLNVVIAEVKRQFLNGAQRIVLTRDGNSIFCEPDDYKVSQCL